MLKEYLSRKRAAEAKPTPVEAAPQQPEPSEKRTRVPLNSAVPEVPPEWYPKDFDFALDAIFCEASGKRLEDLPWLKPYLLAGGAGVGEPAPGTRRDPSAGVVPAAPQVELWGDPVMPEEAERVRDAFRLSPAAFRRKWGMALTEVVKEVRA